MKTLRMLLGALLTLTGGALAACAADSVRPTVLFIAVDDLNHWVGYLGRNPQTITPNIDRLAARGVCFTRSYAVATSCNPSRTALMSGLRPWTTGVYGNKEDGRSVIPENLLLTNVFRRAGYYVAGVGKIGMGSWDNYRRRAKGGPAVPEREEVGKITFAALDCKDEDLGDYATVSHAIEQLKKKHDRPFFLGCGLIQSHLPFNVPKKYYDMHPLDKIELPPHTEHDLDDVPPSGVRFANPQGDHAAIMKAGKWKEVVQAYLAAITCLDANIGRLIDGLDRSPYRDNTIIVFWSDHGWHLGEKDHWRKFTLWEEATRAPLIWVVPGLTRPQSVCERTVDFMTIYPTLTDVCGLATPKHVEGQSIRALLADPKAAWDRPALTTWLYKNHAVRTEGWRYIRYANGDEELYDEARDPYEWTNLALRPEFAARKTELARYLPTKDQPTLRRK